MALHLQETKQWQQFRAEGFPPYNHCHAIFVVREAADITYEPIGLHLTVAPTQLFAMFPDLAPIVPYTPEEMHNPTDEDPEPQALLAIEPSVGSTFND